MTAPRIAILASGRGSNFEAIHGAVLGGGLRAEIAAVVVDRAEAPVVGLARAAGAPTLVVAGEKDRARHNQAVLEALASLKGVAPQFLVLAGYMRILSDELIEKFRSPRGYARIVNVHPSLLPAFPGRDSYAQAFAHGAKVTGVTVHLVESEIDSGPICAQESFSIADCRSAAEVEARGLAVEHRLYPQALDWILAERFDVEETLDSQQRSRLRVRSR